jgi:hypothetical protein
MDQRTRPLFDTACAAVLDQRRLGSVGVTTIGDVFYSWLDAAPTIATDLTALAAALTRNLVLQVGTFCSRSSCRDGPVAGLSTIGG